MSTFIFVSSWSEYPLKLYGYNRDHRRTNITFSNRDTLGELIPYSWVEIDKDLNARNIDLPESTPSSRIFIFDLEIKSSTGDYPNPKNEKDEIITAFIITNESEFMLAQIDNETKSLISSKEPHIMNLSNERELLRVFWSLVVSYKPDRIITYKGTELDIPYILERSSYHDIIIPGGWPLPGIELVDLHRYFKLFHPELVSHKLGDVAHYFLKECKHNISYHSMRVAYESNDPQLLAGLVDNCYEDTKLIYQLWTELMLDLTINRLARETHRHIQDLLAGDSKFVVETPAVGVHRNLSAILNKNKLSYEVKEKVDEPLNYHKFYIKLKNNQSIVEQDGSIVFSYSEAPIIKTMLLEYLTSGEIKTTEGSLDEYIIDGVSVYNQKGLTRYRPGMKIDIQAYNKRVQELIEMLKD